MSRFVRPATTVLTLENGDTLVVKQRLNTGETRAMFEAMYRVSPAGDRHYDPLKTGVSLLQAYLVDWSLLDDEGRPVSILDQGPDVLAAALDKLDYDDFQEILRTVEAHERRMTEIRNEEKKSRTTANILQPT